MFRGGGRATGLAGVRRTNGLTVLPRTISLPWRRRGSHKSQAAGRRKLKESPDPELLAEERRGFCARPDQRATSKQVTHRSTKRRRKEGDGPSSLLRCLRVFVTLSGCRDVGIDRDRDRVYGDRARDVLSLEAQRARGRRDQVGGKLRPRIRGSLLRSENLLFKHGQKDWRVPAFGSRENIPRSMGAGVRGLWDNRTYKPDRSGLSGWFGHRCHPLRSRPHPSPTRQARQKTVLPRMSSAFPHQ